MALIETFVYRLDAADMQWLAPQAESWLAAEELARLQRFKVQERRDVHLASRFMLRHLLAQRLECRPQALQFGSSPNGKPFVQAPTSSWQFNFSHCQDCILLGLAEGVELGVDIERSKARMALRELAERVMSAAELSGYDKLEGAAQEDFFFRAWVLKESYVKLMGTGVWHGLAAVSTDSDAPGYLGQPDIRAHLLSAPDGYQAALAYHSEAARSVRIEQRRVDTLRELATF